MTRVKAQRRRRFNAEKESKLARGRTSTTKVFPALTCVVRL